MASQTSLSNRQRKAKAKVLSTGPLAQVYRVGKDAPSVEGINRSQFNALVRDPTVVEVNPIHIEDPRTGNRQFNRRPKVEKEESIQADLPEYSPVIEDILGA